MAEGLTVAIEKRIGDFHLAMEFTAGPEILVLFGPSGAGKSQTLNAIAGLNHPDRGRIELDGQLFFRKGDAQPRVVLPARRRRVGYVFQHYALFPHLTALENVAFSFWREPDSRPRAARWLRRMRLESLTDRYPHEVSGGQQQRIAIARALAAEPRVLLLDEPFSALDYPLRQQLHEELLRLQDESPLIVIYVTHNLEEALAMGQRLAVVRKGQIEQIGPPADVVSNPRTRRVAEILGLPNIFEARITQGLSESGGLDWNGLQLKTSANSIPAGTRICAYLLPDAFTVGLRDESSPNRKSNVLTGIIKRKQIAVRGAQLHVELENGAEIEVAVPTAIAAAGRIAQGDRLLLDLPVAGVRILETYQ